MSAKKRTRAATASASSESPPRRKRPVLDETKRCEIVAILAVGCSRIVAARYVGCCVSTIRRTALRDEKFAEQLRQAESRHEIQHLTNINSAAKESRYWRAAAWALERRYPERYGQRRPQAVTAEQISQVLAQFADIIAAEISNADDRERVVQRFDALVASLQKEDVETEHAS